MPQPALIALYLAYASILLAVAWIDLRTYRIPNAIVLPAIAVALVAMPWTVGVAPALLGAVLAPLPLVIARLVAGAGKMGMGDIKLAVFVGLILGYDLALVGLFIALVLSLVVWAISVARGTRTWQSKLPFGPYLTAGALPLLVIVSLAL